MARNPVSLQQSVFQTLRLGEITESALTRYGSNYTFLVKVSHNNDEILAIYKPRDGEAPLWDFPRGTLYKREYAAYLLSQILGWDFIPPTIIRDGPNGIGSLQLFVDHDPQSSYYTLKDDRVKDLRIVACFDLLANNADRKPGHCILGIDDKVWGIDHGLTFHADLKVRTVIWEFGEEPIPEELLKSIRHLQGEFLHPQGKVKELIGLLSSEEVAALLERVNWVATNGTFPGLYRRRR